MRFYISCYDLELDTLDNFEVPESVYVYIRQLEGYIKRPHESKLKEVYSFRFGSGGKSEHN